MCCTLAAVKQMIGLENHFSYNEILTWIQVIAMTLKLLLECHSSAL